MEAQADEDTESLKYLLLGRYRKILPTPVLGHEFYPKRWEMSGGPDHAE